MKISILIKLVRFLADAARRALGEIQLKLRNLKCCGYHTFKALFTSGVLSIAVYSAAIWGTKKFAKKLAIKLLGTLLVYIGLMPSWETWAGYQQNRDIKFSF